MSCKSASADREITANSLGSLTQHLCCRRADKRKSSSLAAINLPGTVTAAYDSTNQITTLNGVNASEGNRSNLTVDPSNGDTYGFDERNQIEDVNSPNYAYYLEIPRAADSLDAIPHPSVTALRGARAPARHSTAACWCRSGTLPISLHRPARYAADSAGLSGCATRYPNGTRLVVVS